MLRGQAKYKCVLAFKKHEMVSPKAREPAAALGCDQWLSTPPLPAPISWGHAAGGQVSVEVSHQHSQFQKEQIQHILDSHKRSQYRK